MFTANELPGLFNFQNSVICMKTVESIIKTLQLEPHPEGGYYRETYRSTGSIDKASLNGNYDGPRQYCTGIYFLLTAGNFSAFHRITQDEMWHFYGGDPLYLHVLTHKGTYEKITMGQQLNHAQRLQYTVMGGDWFAAEVAEAGQYALVGCTVAPGFDFRDFEMAERADLIRKFPTHKTLITHLTRDSTTTNENP